jgi:hypothetical protein
VADLFHVSAFTENERILTTIEKPNQGEAHSM